MVETRPIPSLMVSYESALTCSWGKERRRSMPAHAPPNTHANAIRLIAIELTIYIFLTVTREGTPVAGEVVWGFQQLIGIALLAAPDFFIFVL